jgi:bifunctional DNA-binding transcriptional regulator/antitoxin component of YhaV-PrlF toxin-antitoxin module
MAEAGAPYESAAADTLIWLDVTPDGRLDLPDLLRSALEVGRGGRILAQVAKDGTISLVSAQTAIRQAQTIFQRYARPGVSVVDELIAERRVEAAREDQDG